MVLSFGVVACFDGTLQALNCAPMLTHLGVRSASVLAYHPELHSSKCATSRWIDLTPGDTRG